jgi:RHS repeat-associated protein
LRKRGYFNPKKARKTSKTPPAVDYRGIIRQKNFTGKEPDPETGLYYYGARYLDPKTSRWISGDPALGDYLPSAPVSDEARKRNESLPGMGGIFNTVNMHTYHYSFNNPVKYTDPDGLSGVGDWLFREIKKKIGEYIAEYINERIAVYEEYNKENIRGWNQNLKEFNETLEGLNKKLEELNKKPEEVDEKVKEYNEKWEKFDERMKSLDERVKKFDEKMRRFDEKVKKFDERLERFNERLERYNERLRKS